MVRVSPVVRRVTFEARRHTKCFLAIASTGIDTPDETDVRRESAGRPPRREFTDGADYASGSRKAQMPIR
jgi:hypothetical protein